MEIKEINECDYYDGFVDGPIDEEKAIELINQMFSQGMTNFYQKAYKEFKEIPMCFLVSHWWALAMNLETKDSEEIAFCGSVIYAWRKTDTEMTPTVYAALNLLETKYPDKFREIMEADKKTLEAQNNGEERQKTN